MAAERPKKDEKEPDADAQKRFARKDGDFGHEIWGLIYSALAVLVFVSLVSHFANHDSNILGQYLGSALATGLLFLFGPFPVFVVPLGIGYVGWLRLRGDQVNLRSFVLWGLLTVETCVVLAIGSLPDLAAGRRPAAPGNWIGTSIVSLVKPLFGPHMFGPYFITGIALVVTVLLCLRVSPLRAARAMAAAARWFFSLSAAFLGALFKKRNTPAGAGAVVTEQAAPSTTDAASGQTGAQARGTAPAAPGVRGGAAPLDETAGPAADPVEEEQHRLFEQELAAFRSKRRAPIQIMTVETSEVETDEPQLDETELRHAAESEDGKGKSKKRGGAATPTVAVETVAAEAKPYEIPAPSILTDPPPLTSMIDKDSIERNSAILEKTLMNFGVEGKVVAVSPGPVVTRYEIVLAPGVKISKVVNLHNDISMAVGGQPIRIEAPIPGKSAVGIELPNAERQTVYFKHILVSEPFCKSKAKLPVVIGTNISGAPYVADIFKMPHMLIAGQTGSGKSVCINSIICSLLMTKKPDELRLIMIDPKKVELSFYDGIPHLLSPVVTESKEAVKALHWGVAEMERRYKLLAKVGARNIDSFNARVESGKLKDTIPEDDNKPLAFIVIIVDELADLMTKASKDVETLIQRIAQLARAVGIHLIVATQRPSVDIITGPIKANLTSRIAFRTIQGTDSRTILDQIGAEKLLGLGDMLFLRNGAPQVERFHGSFISEEDVEKIVAEVRKQQVAVEKIESFADVIGSDSEDDAGELTEGNRDELFEEAAHIIVESGLGSTSLLQRRLNLGYARAGRIMDQLNTAGIVGPPNGSKAREVIVRPDELDDVLAMLQQNISERQG